MTATASKTDLGCIQNSLGLKNCHHVIANPDRKNIFYKRFFRTGQDSDAVQSILMPIARGLLEDKINYPFTIVYLPLKLCGYAYKIFEYVLCGDQYFPPGSASIPSNRLCAQFHAPQTSWIKQLCSGKSNVRVVFATVAIGMGVDIPDIRQVIHIGPPRTVKGYFQETGCAGRDGRPSVACLYYNNRDIATNRVGMQDDMRMYIIIKDQSIWYHLQGKTRALIGVVGGGGYLCSAQLISFEMNLKTTDFKRNSSCRTQIYEYSPPPPPPINALVSPLTTWGGQRRTIAKVQSAV